MPAKLDMDQVRQVVEQCYIALLDPTGQTMDVNQVEATLMKVYQEPASFGVLISIIQTHQLEGVRCSAVVAMKGFIERHYRDMVLETKAGVYQSLLELMTFPSSGYVRRFVRDIVSTCLEAAFVDLVVSVIQRALADGGDIPVEAALYLSSMIIAYGKTDGAVSSALIGKGMASANVTVQVAAVLHALQLSDQMDEATAETTACFIHAVNLMANLATAKDYMTELKELCMGLTYAVEVEAPCVSVPKLLEMGLQVIASAAIPLDRKNIIHELCDKAIISACEDVVNTPELVKQIFTVYFAFAAETFNEDDGFDLSEHNVFSSVCSEFKEHDSIMGMLWAAIPGLATSPPGLYSVITALCYSFGNTQFFADKLETVSDVLLLGLQSDSYCLSETSARVISELALHQKGDIVQVSNKLITGLTVMMSRAPNAEFVSALAAIVSQVKGIGLPTFTGIFQELQKYLSLPDSEPQFVHSVFRCIVAMVKRSPKETKHFFAPIVEIMQRAIRSEGPAFDLLRPTAINCIGRLATVSTDLFRPLGEGFIGFLLPSFDSPDDLVVNEAVIAYGRLIQNIPDLVRPIAGDVMTKLLGMASRVYADIEEEDDAIFIGEDREMTRLETKVAAVTTAIVMMCCTLSVFVDLIPAYFEQVAQILERQMEQGSADHAMACARGAVFLVEGLQKVGLRDDGTKRLVTVIVALLASLISKDSSMAEGAGQSFEAVADIIAIEEQTGFLMCMNSIDVILQGVMHVFKGEMLYQGGALKWDEDLLVPAQRVLREIMASVKEKSIPVLKDFVPLMNGLVAFPKNKMKDLALQFFGDLVFWAGAGLDDELKGNVMILALDATSKRNSAIGFGCFKQLASVAPHIIAPRLDTVLALIQAQLASDEKTETVMTVQDNCVSALAKIAMNIMRDKFPVEIFLLPALSRMPPQVEVEENNDTLAFMRWLMERLPNQHVNEFAAVLVRLFADGIDRMKEYQVSDENVEWGKGCLRSLLSQIPDAPTFVFNTAGDQFSAEAVLAALQ